MGLFKRKNTTEEELIPLASEAYRQAYKRNKELELQEVSYNIANAIRIGAYSIKDSGELYENTIRVLRDKGYDVVMNLDKQKNLYNQLGTGMIKVLFQRSKTYGKY